ncbi:MAG: hypothetical protein DWI57_12995, partial [Chloroflexi bacterium]
MNERQPSRVDNLRSSPKNRPLLTALLLALLFASGLRLGRVAFAAIPAPGSVDSNLQLWLKADAGAKNGAADASNGNSVSTWEDQSSSAADATVIAAGREAEFQLDTSDSTKHINFNPVLQFEETPAGNTGDQYTFLVDPGITAADDYTVITVQYANTPSSGNTFDTYFSAGNFGYGNFGDGTNGSGMQVHEFLFRPRTIGSTSVLGKAVISGARRNGASGQIYYNGANDTSAPAIKTLDTSLLRIGDNAWPINGDIAEMIIYKTALSTSAGGDLDRINSYLAIKYGITLASGVNYVNSAGSVLWDATANATYHNDVTGIGVDANSALSQLASRSVNSDDMVTITGAGANIVSGEFLLWGNDNGATTFAGIGTVSGVAAANNRFGRVWKAQETNDVGAATITFDSTALQTGKSYCLLVDNDGNFTNGGTTEVACTVASSPVSFSYDFATGSAPFFSLGTVTTAPGGVESNLGLWLKANAGTSSSVDGASLTAWQDQSPSGNNATGVNAPTYENDASSLINTNPIVHFDEVTTEYFTFASDLGIVGTNDFTLFSVQKAATPGNTILGPNTISHLPGPYYQYASSFEMLNVHAGITLINRGAINVDDGKAHLSGAQRASNNFYVYHAGEVDAGPTNNTTSFASVGMALGAAYNATTQRFDGDMAEVIVYNRALSNAERQRVDSYLALKYGLTLSNTLNYVDGAGVTIWDTSVNAAYYNDVAGIGIDANSALTQTTSASVNSDNIVTITGTLASMSSGEFLLWGNDNGATTASTQVPTGYSQRLTREWKVDETGEVGTVTIAFDLTGISLVDFTKTAEFALLIDTDGDFSNATVTTGASVSGNRVTFNGVDLSDGQFFSLAFPEPPAPGGVASTLQLWMKANAGVTESGGNAITQWLDSAGQHTPTGGYYSDPDLLDSGSDLVNFNPVVHFDNDDYMRWEGDPFPTSFTAGELFIVGKEATPDTADHYSLFDFGGGGSQPRYTYSDRRIYDDFGSSDRKRWTPSNTAEAGGEGAADATIGGPNRLTTDYHIYNVLSQTNNWQAAFDGVTALTDATNTVNFSFEPGSVPHLGGAYGGFSNGGRVAEVVLFNRVLTASERQAINSYLALKYGITLGVDYVDSAGNTLWNVTTNGTYTNDVAGIGVDSASGLSQLASRSINADGMVTITGTLATISSGEFLLWGNDNGATTASSEVPAGYSQRLTREWKVTDIGDTGVVTITFDLTGIVGIDLTKPAEFALLIGTDGDFSNATATTGASVSGNRVTFNGVNLGNGQFFSLAYPEVPAPGGVNPNLQLWLKADAGFTPSQWSDQSGNSNHALQSTAANQPAQVANSLNANPVVRFSGNRRMQISSSVAIHEVIAVFQKTIGSGTAIGGRVNDALSTGYFFSGGGRLISGATGSNYLYSDTAIDVSSPNIVTLSYNTSVANVGYRVNGQILSATVVDGGLNPSGAALPPFSDSVWIGFDNSGAYFNGDLAELVIYSNNPSATAREQIESYLGLKYGIPIAHNYLNSSGAILWNVTTNSTYTNDVAGIGVDSASGLSQLTSHSVNADGMVTITGTLANIANGDFLFWGNDNGATAFQGQGTVSGITTTANTDSRFGRVWKAQETNDVGAVTLHFDSATLQTGKTYCLLVDDDGNFTNGGSTEVACAVANSPISFSHDFDTTTAPYFTLGTQASFPGGVNANLQLWLKANVGVTESGGNDITQWLDSAGLHTPTGGYYSDPDLMDSGSDLINFNPVVHFDNDDYMRWEGDPFPTSFTAGELFIVGKEATPDTADHYSLFDFGGGGSGPRYTFSDRRIYDDFGSSDRKVWTPSNTATAGAEGATGATVSGPNRLTTDYHIYNILSETNNWQAAFDGVTALTDSTNTVIFSFEPGSVPHLGGAYGGFSNGGRVAEV